MNINSVIQSKLDCLHYYIYFLTLKFEVSLYGSKVELRYILHDLSSASFFTFEDGFGLSFDTF